jgi:hypothetical protein
MSRGQVSLFVGNSLCDVLIYSMVANNVLICRVICKVPQRETQKCKLILL